MTPLFRALALIILMTHIPIATADITPLDWAEADGSGAFGEWIWDDAGLPAYSYTLDQERDPLGVYETFIGSGVSRDHWFQLGNARLVALAHVDGSIEVFDMDEVAMVRNHIQGDTHSYGGGFAYLIDADSGALASTHHQDLPEGAVQGRTYGTGYAERHLQALNIDILETTFAPYGDVPALVQTITLTNPSSAPRTLRYLPYWDVNLFERFPGLQESGGLSLGEVWPMATRFGDDASILIAAPQGGSKGDTVNIYPTYPPVMALAPLDPQNTTIDGWDSDCRGVFGDGDRGAPQGLNDGQAHNSLLLAPLSDLTQPACLILQHTLSLAPGESKTLSFVYAFGGSIDEATATIQGLRGAHPGDPNPGLRIHEDTQDAWASALPSFDLPGFPGPAREMTWSAYMLSAGSLYSRYADSFTLTQGSAYLYDTGLNAAPRDPLQHVMAAIYTDPALARESLAYWMSQQKKSGYLPYSIYGRNWQSDLIWKPSDLSLWLILALLEYVDATGDSAFLAEWIPFFPLGSGEGATVLEHLKLAYTYLMTEVGVGRHGLLHLQMYDWNDGLLSPESTQAELLLTRRRGESTLNSTMAVYVFERLAERLALEGESALAFDVEEERERLRRASINGWNGDHFNRGYVGNNEELGAGQIYLEPQPWVFLVSDLLNPINQGRLLEVIDSRLVDDTGLGTRVLEIPHEGGEGLGEVTNGGIWAAVNGWLVWGVSHLDPSTAFDYWLDNTFVNHAERFPETWFGIWSGPDAYNASMSERPGETWVIPGAAMQAFPIMNHHPHAWPLFNAIVLSGYEARGGLIKLAPKWPMPAFSTRCALFELEVGASTLRFHHKRLEGGIVEVSAPEGWDQPRKEAFKEGDFSLRVGGREKRVSVKDATLRVYLEPGEVLDVNIHNKQTFARSQP